MKTVTAFNKDGSTTKFLCSEDEHGNLWVRECPDNEGKGMLGSCFVPNNGNAHEARQHSITYVTGEGKHFVVGDNPNAAVASRLLAIQARVIWDSKFAAKVAGVLNANELILAETDVQFETPPL